MSKINWSHFVEEEGRLREKLGAFHPKTGERLYPNAGTTLLVDATVLPFYYLNPKECTLARGAIGCVQILTTGLDPWLVAGGYYHGADTHRVYIWANGDVANCPEPYKAVVKEWARTVLDLHDEKRCERRIQGRVKRFKEELMMEMWRPERVERLLESGHFEAVV